MTDSASAAERGILTRSEEHLGVDVADHEVGRVRARKVVDVDAVVERVDVGTEHADVERHAPLEADSGEVETLPDGSLSIPVFEEQLVVTKRLVVRERIVIRKRTVVEEQVVSADLRRERIEIDADPAVAERVVDARGAEADSRS